MAYSRNFGFRTFENLVRDGRNRAPAAGFVIGAPVTLDTAAPGRLKLAGNAAAPNQVSGLAVFEHIQAKGVDTSLTTHYDAPFNLVPGNAYTQMVHGVGAKIWLRNTSAKTLYDGREQAAGGLLAMSDTALAGLGVGSGLVPDGNGKYKAAGATDTPWLVIEIVNAAALTVEARLTF